MKERISKFRENAIICGFLKINHCMEKIIVPGIKIIFGIYSSDEDEQKLALQNTASKNLLDRVEKFIKKQVIFFEMKLKEETEKLLRDNL